MVKINNEQTMGVLRTKADKKLPREASKVISKEVISAAKYYIGVPDGQYFSADDFDESVVKAQKAYVTLNTLMGGMTAEWDRFNEGKKQVPGLLTPLGVHKMINLFTLLYSFASSGINVTDIIPDTVRACRHTEVSVGESTVGPLMSTTKLSIDEIMKLGYGDKNGLAICLYKFYKGACVFDMEQLGDDYLKPEEREVLILMGNQLHSYCMGYDDRYIGRDGQPALMYQIDVYPPCFGKVVGDESQEELESIVYNGKSIENVKKFYEALNAGGNFPTVPKYYQTWKGAFQKLVYRELKKLS